jgi:hypothetical protein
MAAQHLAQSGLLFCQRAMTIHFTVPRYGPERPSISLLGGALVDYPLTATRFAPYVDEPQEGKRCRLGSAMFDPIWAFEAEVH